MTECQFVNVNWIDLKAKLHNIYQVLSHIVHSASKCHIDIFHHSIQLQMENTLFDWYWYPGVALNLWIQKPWIF